MEDRVKTLKGISNETWIKFKVLAAKKNVPLGKLFEEMLNYYEKKADSAWKTILSGEKIISDKEAEEMHAVTKKIRKGQWARNVYYT